MITKSKVLGMGLAALMAVGMIAAPAIANAQSWRYNRTRSEDSARANALGLGVAGALLLGNHQTTLGTIALGAAALEGIQSQNDIDARHDSYGYSYYYGGDRDDYRRVDRDGDKDRDRDNRGGFWSNPSKDRDRGHDRH